MMTHLWTALFGASFPLVIKSFLCLWQKNRLETSITPKCSQNKDATSQLTKSSSTCDVTDFTKNRKRPASCTLGGNFFDLPAHGDGRERFFELDLDDVPVKYLFVLFSEQQTNQGKLYEDSWRTLTATCVSVFVSRVQSASQQTRQEKRTGVANVTNRILCQVYFLRRRIHLFFKDHTPTKTKILNDSWKIMRVKSV